MSTRPAQRPGVPKFHVGFFAARADQVALLDYLIDDLGLKVFELNSEPSRNLREFRSSSEADDAVPLGQSPKGEAPVALLQLWSPEVAPQPVPERFELDPRRCGGHTFRHRLSAPGLIQLYLGGLHQTVLTLSTLGHLSEADARIEGQKESVVDWQALRKLTHKIHYHVGRRMAAAKVPGCSVMPEALALVRAGVSLRSSVKTPWAFELTDIRKPPSRGPELAP